MSIECSVVHEVEFGGTHRWFVGQIEAAHVDESYPRHDTLIFWGGEYRAVGEVLLRRYPVPMERIGVRDAFGRSGNPQDLLEYFDLTPSAIAGAARRAMVRRDRRGRC